MFNSRNFSFALTNLSPACANSFVGMCRTIDANQSQARSDPLSSEQGNCDKPTACLVSAFRQEKVMKSIAVIIAENRQEMPIQKRMERTRKSIATRAP
jgi:hypothetical protein